MSDTPVPRDAKFQALDRDAELKITERNLPHWFQPGAATFVTFRTHDSMPQKAMELWSRRLRQFLASMHIEDNISLTEAAKRLSPSAQRVFQKYRAASFHKILDRGFGNCELRKPPLSRIVAEALHFYDGTNYEMDRFVVMPNHVHLLAAFNKEYDMRQSLENILHYSAFRINKLLGRSGPFWQSEPFDHCIRNESQFVWVQQYIKNNPKKARLSPSCYYFWQRPQ